MRYLCFNFLQDLLNFDDPLNREAADQFSKDKELFGIQVKEYLVQYAKRWLKLASLERQETGFPESSVLCRAMVMTKNIIEIIVNCIYWQTTGCFYATN